MIDIFAWFSFFCKKDIIYSFFTNRIIKNNEYAKMLLI